MIMTIKKWGNLHNSTFFGYVAFNFQGHSVRWDVVVWRLVGSTVIFELYVPDFAHI